MSDPKEKADTKKLNEKRTSLKDGNNQMKDRSGKKKTSAEMRTGHREKGAAQARNEVAKTVSTDRGALIFGMGLLILGVFLLVGKLLRIPLGGFLWPFIFIVPGVLVFSFALSSEDRHGEGLSIFGSILTMVGMIFLAQSITGLWASWAYSWALVVPTSMGIAQLIYGGSKERPGIAESGRRLAKLGLIMFAVGFIFFELIIGVSGFGIASLGLPVFPMILIFAGVLVLVLSILKR